MSLSVLQHMAWKASHGIFAGSSVGCGKSFAYSALRRSTGTQLQNSYGNLDSWKLPFTNRNPIGILLAVQNCEHLPKTKRNSGGSLQLFAKPFILKDQRVQTFLLVANNCVHLPQFIFQLLVHLKRGKSQNKPNTYHHISKSIEVKELRNVETCGKMWKHVEKCGNMWRNVEGCGGGGKRRKTWKHAEKHAEKLRKTYRSETLKCRTVGILCRPMLASAIRTLRSSSFRNSWTSIFARSNAENKRDCRVFSSKFSPRRKLTTIRPHMTTFTLQFLPFQSTTIKRLTLWWTNIAMENHHF